jgi:hypothetical protein
MSSRSGLMAVKSSKVSMHEYSRSRGQWGSRSRVAGLRTEQVERMREGYP